MQKFIILTLFLFSVVSCKKKTSYSNTPKLEFKNLSKAVTVAGGKDKVIISFQFEDGDGNIGFGTKNLFLIESRTGDTLPYTIPDIPSKYNPSDGLKGIMTIDYLEAFLLLRNDSTHKKTDTLHWDIYMKDQVGNTSNVITTTDLILKDTL